MGQKWSLLGFSLLPPIGAPGDGSVSGMFSDCRNCQWCIVAPPCTQWFLSPLIISKQSVSCTAQIPNLEEGSLYGGYIDGSYIKSQGQQFFPTRFLAV